MQLKRTNIVVKFNRKNTKSSWLSAWSEWYNTAGHLNWIKALGTIKTVKPKRDVEKDRIELVKLAREIESQIFSDETVARFKRKKWKLPIGFTVNNVTRLAVHKSEPEEICISGYGDTALLEEWLNANQYNYTIKNTF